MAKDTPASPASRRSFWPDYRTVWRWHLYAGLICMPFVLWLAATGSIYLFKPQIEAALERPYDRLMLSGPPKPPTLVAQAALAAVPGSVLSAYELPKTPTAAPRVILSHGAEKVRVYVRPDDLKVLKVLNEDDRFMRVVFRLHGELMMGDRGSYIVELAACWAIVLLVTGLFLWWPRGAAGLAGALWPRFDGGSRQFWRDLHAVTGVWISLFALCLLLTGLPWAKNWGGYLKEVRRLAGATQPIDWTTGRASELAQRRADDAGARAALQSTHPNHGDMAGMDMGGMDMGGTPARTPGRSIEAYGPLDRLAPKVASLDLPPPVLISPPRRPGGPWTARSDAADRPLRVNLTLDPESGAVLKRVGFSQRHWIDRIVDVGVAAHEGALFGALNQALGLVTALGLMLVSASAAVMWWRRRPDGTLGAPPAMAGRRIGPGAVVIAALMVIYLPLLGLSLIAVLALERLLLRRLPGVREWLGLQALAR
jgi:uncharacterized iron-regulated membrane protein